MTDDAPSTGQLAVRWADGPKNARRIPTEMWEQHRDEILKFYKDNTLADTRNMMDKKYGFGATTRQFVHHIQTIWGVTKYKQNSPKDTEQKKKPKLSSTSRPPDDANGTPNTPEDGDSGDSPPDAMVIDPPEHSPPSFGSNRDSQQVPPETFVPLGHGAQLLLPASYPQPALDFNMDAGGFDYDQLRLAADVHATIGHPSAFQLYQTICQASGDPVSRSDLVACGRAALTTENTDAARRIFQDSIDKVLEGISEGSPWAALTDLQVARTYDWGRDRENAIGQIEQRISAMLEGNSKPTLKLGPRSGLDYGFNIPLFIYLDYALIRWNENGKGGEDDQIDADDFLYQYVNHQLDRISVPGNMMVFNNLTCLQSCLSWCSETLRKSPPVAERLVRNMPGPYDTLTATYMVFATLWSIWLRELPRPTRPTWGDQAQHHLGISAAELLGTLICMTMTGTPEPRTSNTIMAHASQRIARLTSMDQCTLFDRFLRQVRLNNTRRMLAPRITNPLPPPQIFIPFSTFVFETLNLDVPHFGITAPTYPMELDTDQKLISKSPDSGVSQCSILNPPIAEPSRFNAWPSTSQAQVQLDHRMTHHSPGYSPSTSSYGRRGRPQ